MNDTETEARRLLAAGTEDMPPGIDLLGGFAAARRKRARRTRTGAVLAAGIATAAASVTAVTLTTGSAPPARAALTSALTRTLKQSYHLIERHGLYEIQNGQVAVRSDYTCTSKADPARHLEEYSCPNIADVVNEREVGRYRYSYSPVPTDGKHWFRYPKGCIGHLPAEGDITTVIPQRMLAEIKQSYKVTVAGPVAGPGWTGTRYAFTSSGSDGGGVVETDSGTVDVDQQGRARSLTLTIRITNAPHVSVIKWALTFSDFGAPVTVTPPPPDQTISQSC